MSVQYFARVAVEQVILGGCCRGRGHRWKIDEVQEDVAYDLSKIHAGNHFLESLFAPETDQHTSGEAEAHIRID